MQDSYWELQALRRTPDLLVVGAGLVGLSAALHYQWAHPAAHVVVLERLPGLANASTRNAGFACFGSAGELLADLDRLGEARTLQRVRLRYEGLQLLRQTLGDNEIGYEASGGFELFRTHDEAAPVVARLSQLNALLAPLTGTPETYRVTQAQGMPAIQNGLEGALHSGWMMQRLLTAARQAGVEVRYKSDAAQIEDGKLVLADGTQVASPRILLATGPRTPLLLPEVAVAPGRGYLFLTNPLPRLAWRGTWHFDRGYVYWRNLDGRLLLGGGRNQDLDAERTLEPGANPRIRAYLVAFAEQALGIGTHETDWRIDLEWSGIMGFAPDDTPFVREVWPGVWAAAGLGGIGVATGMALGREAAAAVTTSPV